MSKSPLSHAMTLFTKQEGIKVHQARSGIRGKSVPSGSEAEHTLINDDHLRVRHLDEVTKEFGDIGCFALELSSRICQKTERAALANDASRRVVKLNPFMWQSLPSYASVERNRIRRKCFSFRAPIYLSADSR
ncbi:cell division cycle protein 27 homolog [Uranotaenia lowii]|uniref:cell division cycle protein 27 homolog n=1 Tax=Uranotaenia lowii TaxID=190385 RepID=UPI002478A6CB|nr:cell division cycle protein 27 homolog isoform X2 [Uranotaenia lowii]XP_055598428.1 cell division cycle protein 27 homolog [Uranotaenia lowii]